MPSTPVMSFSTALPVSRLLHTSAVLRTPRLSIRHFAPRTKRLRTPKSLVAPPGAPSARRVAVVGGGLAGLAVTYHLLHSTARLARKRGLDPAALRVTILDPAPPGLAGASAAAAGLLHPFTPRAKKKAWKARRSVPAARHLLDLAQARHPHRALARFDGLLRLALTEKMQTDFRQAAHRFPDEIDFLNPDQLRHIAPDAPHGLSAALIKDAAVVDTTAYLQALWDVCNDTGRVQWQKHKVTGLASVLAAGRLTASASNTHGEPDRSDQPSASFDTVIFCAGASIKAIPEFQDFPLTPCRGQNLHLEAIHPDTSIPLPLISGKYVVPDYFPSNADRGSETNGDRTAQRIIAGATFEYKDPGETDSAFLEQACKTDLNRATSELSEPLHKLVPDLFKSWKVCGTSSGTRALPPRSDYGSIPIACKVNNTSPDLSCWVFTGLGSRGLLHHAYLGRMLAHAVVAGNEKLIPIDARRFSIDMQQLDDLTTVAP